jgi:hypothetical protein
LIASGVLASTHDLAVADLVDDREVFRGHLDAASLLAAAVPNERDNPLAARINDLDRLGLELVKEVEPLLQIGASSLPATPMTSDRSPFDVIRPVVSECLETTMLPGPPCSFHNFHVPLRHHLLREAGGFECFTFGLEGLDPDHEAVSDCVHVPEGPLHLRPTCLALATQPEAHDDVVSRVDERL